MALSLYNTLGRKMEVFTPLASGKAGFYGCGPTVYNYAHIGNLRAYVTHDVLVRTLRERGYAVTHVMNITDVGHLSGDNDEGEDKMVKSAEEARKSVLEVAHVYTEAFFRDTGALNIARPDVVCKATEHIDDMIALIKRIEAGGYTYSSGGNLYFDVTRFPNYGELALLRLDDLEAGARVDVDENKRNPHDFVLWFTKSKFENQALVWDSPWGRGYPGWHIECSAMSSKYLGEQFDIHAGGIDHIPIHHTNEIAQAEAGYGKHPWVRYWVHNEFLVLNKGKMSKSTGGFLTLQTLLDNGFEPLDYRFFLLGAHYRSQLQFSFDALKGARNSRASLLDRLRALARKTSPEKVKAADAAGFTDNLGSTGKAAQSLAAFDAAIDDDLSTPRALAELWGVLRDNTADPAEAVAAAFRMDRILGLGLEEAAFAPNNAELPGNALPAEIENLIAERTEAKKEKRFARADEIRNLLKERGFILEDSKDGTTICHGGPRRGFP
ncbi:MAG: cysteine--tRNA ligase [Spirochaetaceae bacterium]|jgi:cysteinyl-tRNA synthetase|nr:cysteine--tRNA ligase [Spirochaetaceae bacterium]